MPFPSGVSRITFNGIHGLDEIWSFGFHVSPFVMTDAIMDDIETAARALMSDGRAKIAGACALTEIKYAQLDVNGRYASDDQPFVREVNPEETGGGGAKYVPQASMVVSLQTGSRRGLAHAGRFYLPPTTLQADNSGLIGAFDQGQLADVAKEFLDDVAAAIAPANIIVASNRGAGAIKDVTGIRMGQVIDTQRRRRNALPENYLDRALA